MIIVARRRLKLRLSLRQVRPSREWGVARSTGLFAQQEAIECAACGINGGWGARPEARAADIGDGEIHYDRARRTTRIGGQIEEVSWLVYTESARPKAPRTAIWCSMDCAPENDERSVRCHVAFCSNDVRASEYSPSRRYAASHLCDQRAASPPPLLASSAPFVFVSLVGADRSVFVRYVRFLAF